MISEWYGVAHSSVRITLRDPAGNEKILDLSPVLLSRSSEYFAARYRPGGNEWAPALLEVEDVEIADKLMRAIYDQDAWFEYSDDVCAEWREYPVILRLMDVLQMQECIVDKILREAKVTIDALAEACKGAADEAPLAIAIAEDLVSLRSLSFGHLGAFRAMMRSAVSLLGRTRKTNPIDALRDLSASARLEMLFSVAREDDVFRTGDSDVAARYVGAALIMIAKALRDAKDDREVQPILELLIHRDKFQAINHEGFSGAMKVLHEIPDVDPTAVSTRLQARDKMALLMRGVVFARTVSEGSRKRGRGK